MHPWWNDGERLDTLRLGADEYGTLLTQVGADADAWPGLEQREHTRFRYWRQGVAVRFHRQGRAGVPYAVKPHNLSARGMAFLHGFFVQTGTRCDLALRNRRGEVAAVSGRVVRCRCVRGKVHELGVEFDELIDLREFLPAEILPASAADSCGEVRFTGRLLYVDDRSDYRELVEFFGQELGLEVRTAGSETKALAAVQGEEFDVILARAKLAGAQPGDLPRAVRDLGYGRFLAAVCESEPGHPEEAARIEAEVLAQGCNAVLSEPVTPERLADLLRGVLPRKQGGDPGVAPLRSSRWSNERMRPLIRKFVAGMDRRLRGLETLAASESPDELQRACREWMTLAWGYGYAPMAAALSELDALAAAQARPTLLRAKLAELARVCAAARLAAE